MFSLTPKPLFLSTPFLPNHLNPAQPPLKSPPKTLSVSALIIPPSSSSYSQNQKQKQQQQQLYLPFKPPPSPLPSKYRSLDTNGRLDILTNRMGPWFEYAPLISSLTQEGFTSSTLEEITGIASIEQNRLVVASQVRDSLVECCTDDETVSYFDSPGSPEILYEIRILNTPQRSAAARFIIDNGFDGKRAEELARSMKDFPRRSGDRGWESFDGNSPGDCLAFMYFRQALEHKSAFFPELSKAALERALEVAETERAKQRVVKDLERSDEEGEGGVEIDELVRVPVVRLAIGEVAESSVVVVLPVCRAEGREIELEAAPWECGMEGNFGIVQAEKGWKQWVVLPGWSPVVPLKRGGVVVAFPQARGVLPWKGKRRDADEEVLVVADRGRKEVEYDDGFYLVVSGGNGSGEEGLKVERGAKLKEMGVEKSLGTVVLVVRPPREEMDDQLGDDAWE
ncbi:hypothetical protein BUALT_Bualt06G0042000 [Buddleja alternifolia]|uniref:Rubisco accumulation factor 1.1, chloroplastic n=1 Tax=Buddleja alternifolia TaxID=168488 RepID=A0AAV6XE10_9LAMI|nr:hypothetical protein BUALT_Bualt06G0042000 [Buddleja alternifolia]